MKYSIGVFCALLPFWLRADGDLGQYEEVLGQVIVQWAYAPHLQKQWAQALQYVNHMESSKIQRTTINVRQLEYVFEGERTTGDALLAACHSLFNSAGYRHPLGWVVPSWAEQKSDVSLFSFGRMEVNGTEYALKHAQNFVQGDIQVGMDWTPLSDMSMGWAIGCERSLFGDSGLQNLQEKERCHLLVYQSANWGPWHCNGYAQYGAYRAHALQDSFVQEILSFPRGEDWVLGTSIGGAWEGAYWVFAPIAQSLYSQTALKSVTLHTKVYQALQTMVGSRLGFQGLYGNLLGGLYWYHTPFVQDCLTQVVHQLQDSYLCTVQGSYALPLGWLQGKYECHLHKLKAENVVTYLLGHQEVLLRLLTTY